MNVEFNEKFDKRNCLYENGMYYVITFVLHYKRPQFMLASLCRPVAKRPGAWHTVKVAKRPVTGKKCRKCSL